jgi:16S rRNA C967 or C1407 C5-methylase (RsmB/RsmF family)/NOL1/NOP2/fmu family ribosome biogenesis protein
MIMIKESFRKYLEEAIGSENALVAFSAFEKPSSVSVRLNPFKKGCNFEGRNVPWCPHGILLQERPGFTLDPFFHAGAYYVQDSSSMFVGHVFRKLLKDVRIPDGRPLRVLDLCAAPGGKTTDLAASLREYLGDGFLLVANEVMKARVGILADNVAIWGDPNVVVTSDDPSAFSSLTGYFDIILADVPCSGEGMFRKDEQAQSQWSEDNVALCEARQRRIIADVWPSLAPGGVFIYSTCTFNKYENDGNVRWVASELGAEVLAEDFAGGFDGIIKTECGYSLVPGHVEGEGQYCAALIKGQEIEYKSSGKFKSDSCSKTVQLAGIGADVLNIDVLYSLKGDTVLAVPKCLHSDVDMLRRVLHVVASGCAVGTMKGKLFIPGADLALSIALAAQAYPKVDVDRKTALAYLHRDAIVLPDAEKGYVLICHNGVPLGFVKNIGNRCNSLHPQSRRIRMDIK